MWYAAGRSTASPSAIARSLCRTARSTGMRHGPVVMVPGAMEWFSGLNISLAVVDNLTKLSYELMYQNSIIEQEISVTGIAMGIGKGTRRSQCFPSSVM